VLFDVNIIMERMMGIKDCSDIELIQQYLKGGNEAFDALYERYKRQIYSYLSRLMGGRKAECDDMFQQTWLRIIKRLPEYQCRQRFLAWAMRIAHNLAMDHFRRNSRVVTEDIDLQNDQLKNEKEPWLDMARGELSKVIDMALAELAPELREVFLLRLEKVSFKEIAEIQGCSINTALGRMQYALRNLQRYIVDTEYGGGNK